MKKFGIIAVLVLIACGAWIISMGGLGTNKSAVDTVVANKDSSESARASLDMQSSNVDSQSQIDFAENEDEWVDVSEEPVQPAVEVYHNAEDALNAIKKAASEYDDLVLEQFAEPDKNCSWCPEFYTEVSKLMLAAKEDSDEKSYFAEVLALSGRSENIEAIINEMKNLNPESPDFSLYADALEMSVGDDEVVKTLSKNLDNASPELQESILAAVSNQGTPFAIDLLYRYTLESESEDGFYNKGIGLGEVIPDKEAFPLMREIVSKREKFSPLAVKGLLNAGVEGLQVVFETLNTSNDSEKDRTLLEGAVDHITYDDETEQYLREVVVKSSNPALVEFAKEGIEYLSEESGK
jgi:dihydroxyacetone kinase DhaKLM complex PTS-EIIA-like component DhaM